MKYRLPSITKRINTNSKPILCALVLLLFTVIGHAQIYCAGGANATYEKIGNVAFGGINNDSTSTADYEDFTSDTARVQIGKNYPIAASIFLFNTSDEVRVWIDYNHNGDFTDAGELVASSGQLVAMPYSTNISIPTTAALGATRMRVRLNSNTPAFLSNTSPCGTIGGFGQVEDYTVYIGFHTSISSANVTAFGGSDGSASITATSGTAPYSYVWSNGKTTPNVTGLSAGIYRVKVTDAAGIITVDSVTVTQPIIAPDANGILYVDSAAAARGTGGSWAAAIDSLNIALNAAKIINASATTSADSVRQIWVAKGTYQPRADSAFFMLPKVKIYGSFTGTETSLSQRSLKTGISSILKGNNNSVIINNNNGLDTTAVLDGFVVTGGQVKGNINDYLVGGAGIGNLSVSPILSNLLITDNDIISVPYVRGMGGAMLNFNSSPILINVSIINNTATFFGGGIYNANSSPKLINVTISKNHAGSYGGGIYNVNSSSIIENSILLGNTSVYGARFADISMGPGATATISYSLIGGSTWQATWGTDNGHNIITVTNPFVDTANGNFSLQSTSQAINAGTNSVIPSWDTTDLAGNSRIYNLANGGIVDMGAFENQTIQYTPGAGNILYVNQSVSSGNGSGGSWANAIAQLSDVLKWARQRHDADANWLQSDSLRIFVAKGTYRPQYSAVDGQYTANGSRDNAFVLVKNVQLYGGFDPAKGIDSLNNTRIFDTTGTVLNGDIGTANNITDNAYHVVVSSGNVGNALLNGFTITGGNADDGNSFGSANIGGLSVFHFAGGGIFNTSSSPVLMNVRISNNNGVSYGGGMYNTNSSPILTNVTISGNEVPGSEGGGMYNFSSSPILTNVRITDNVAYDGGGMCNFQGSSAVLTDVTISSNKASNSGGAMYNSSSGPVLTNITVSNNSAGIGGGIYNFSSYPQIYNSIIWGNTKTDGTTVDNITNSNSGPVYTYSLVQGSRGSGTTWNTAFGIDGGNNVDANPLFSNAAGGGLALQFTSPAINAGNNARIPGWDSTDLAGNPRIYNPTDGGIVDMGAYEFQGNPFRLKPDVNGILYVDSAAAVGGTGGSWAAAIDSLNIALNAAKIINAIATTSADSVRQIWVAKGTYQPETDSSFFMLPKVKIYGGFAGTETGLSQRNLKNGHSSLLKGNNNTVIRNDNNGLDTSSVLDGFVITGGNTSSQASGNYGQNGGGMYNYKVSPVISNCIITQNTVPSGGGGAGLYNRLSSIQIINCVIANNNANSAWGGGITNDSSSLTLTNCTVSGNTAKQGGGVKQIGGNMTIIHSLFIGNKSNLGGGIDFYSGDTLYILSSIFYNNIAQNSDGSLGSGGAVQGENSTVVILDNSLLVDNKAAGTQDDGGGAVMLYGQSKAILTNVTLFGNTTASAVKPDGNGISTIAGTTININNSIVYSSGSKQIENLGTANIMYSLVKGSGLSSNGNLDVFPKFTDTSNLIGPDNQWGTTDDGLRLNINSLAINAGSNTLYQQNGGDTLTDVDLAGNPRVYKGGHIDMGAFEFQGNPIRPTNGILYVDSAATAGSTGSGWATAIDSLNIALNAAQIINANATSSADSVKQIWVAKGTYQPEADSAFFMLPKVKIYGSFAGTETSLSQRPPMSPSGVPQGAGAVSILKGNNNSVIINNHNGLDTSAVLDGFVVTRGFTANSGGGIYNNQVSPMLRNLNIYSSVGNLSGGGVYDSLSSPVMTNVIISSNMGHAGGGIYNAFSSPAMTNVAIFNNSSVPGAVFNSESTPAMNNVTISGNMGGGIYNTNSSTAKLTNSIIWNNVSSNGGYEISNDATSATNLDHSLYSHASGADSGSVTATNSITSDPMFVDAATYNFLLQSISPAINAGTNSVIPSRDSTDLAGNSRIYNLTNGGTVDMGAFEFQGNPFRPKPDADGILYVDSAAAAGGNGSSWASAIDSLNIALSAAQYINANATSSADSVKQIWVSKGTYQPETDSSFFMLPKVKIYGGFLGTETSLSQRPPMSPSGGPQGAGAGAASILKGNHNSVIINNHNGLDTTAVLDGFTITGGYGDGNSTITNGDGGGIFNRHVSPTLSNLVVNNNVATRGGGGMSNEDSSFPFMSHITINGNVANIGGGIYNNVSSPHIVYAVISSDSAYQGGGIFNNASSPALTNVIISGNKANGNCGNGDGGGIFNTGYQSGGKNFSFLPVLTNVTIVGNTANLNGGGISSSANNTPSSITMTNCILWNNTALGSGNDIYSDGGATTHISYSYTQTAQSGTGNITGSSDPFVNSTKPAGQDGFFGTIHDGLELKNGSSAINAGDPQTNAAGYPVQAGNTDITGNSRITDGRIDMGAYEHQDSVFITTQPKDTTVCAGSNVSFDLSAIGSNFSYQWQSSTDAGKTWNNTAVTADTLRLPNVQVSDSGTQYRAIVSGILNTDTSAVAVLQVNLPVSVLAQPKDTTVNQGNQVSFGVTATGNITGYQWQSSTDGTSWSNIIGATAPALSIPNAASSLNGMHYRVSILGPCGITYSSPATLTVNTPVTITITTQPSNQTVNSGASATFSVTATGTGTSLGYQWQSSTDGTHWNNITAGTAASLGLSNVQSSDNGTEYRAIITGSGISDTSNTATLTVNTPVTITITTQPANQTVNSGASATFSVTATGTGTSLSYQWQSSTDGTHWNNVTNGNSGTLELSNVQTSDSGTRYRAIITGIGISDTSNISTLTVNTPVIITSQPVNQTACIGSHVNFVVVATGTGLSYQWQSSADGTNWNNETAGTAETLELSNVQTSDNGLRYRALVSANGMSVISDTAILTVNPLQMITITADHANPVSKGILIHLTAAGTQSYQWNGNPDIQSGLGDSVISIQPEQDETFTVTGTTAAGCVSTQTYAVQVVEDFKLKCNNILTPNGDGINDTWIIQNINSYPDNKVMIFDQSGREVYEKENYDNTWNGTNNGRPLLEGTYYYIFIAHGANGKQKVFKGFIELLNGRR